MGGKQIGPGKYIFYSITCLIFLSLFGCAALDALQTREEAKGSLREGHKLLVRGNYEEALDKYQKALALSSRKPPEDEALFYIGLIYASSLYPKRDTKKSMDFFTDILNDWPQSPFVEQAKIWLGVLHENERMNLLLRKMRPQGTKPAETKPLEGKTEDVGEGRESQTRSQRLLAAGDFEGFVNENQRVLSLAHPRSSKEEALFNLGLVYAHEGNPKKDFSKSLDFFKRLIRDHPKSPLVEQAKIWVGLLQEYESLNQVIQKLKQVDIEVEERKREQAK
jgi:tetratricopeptide (TPR) repeat protein